MEVVRAHFYVNKTDKYRFQSNITSDFNFSSQNLSDFWLIPIKSDQIWKFESWGDVPICLNSGSNDHNFETCGQKVSI